MRVAEGIGQAGAELLQCETLADSEAGRPLYNGMS